MSAITVLWSMNAAACLTLAGTHLLVWLNSRRLVAYLLFSISAAASAGMAACELLAMRAATVEQFVTVLRWGHVAIWILVAAVVWFARIYLRAGREWLAWTVVATRTLCLVLSFCFPGTLSYSSLAGLQHITFLGEEISILEGTPNPWSAISLLSSALLLAFFVDAARTVWKRGEHRRAVVLGGSMMFFILVAAVHSALLQALVIKSPYLVSFAFLGITLAMAFELSRDLFRATQLVTELQVTEAGLRESEERMILAADAAQLGVWTHDLVRDEIWASEKWRELFGFSPGQRLDADQVLLRITAADRVLLVEAINRAVGGEKEFEIEYQAVLPGGAIRWIATRGRVEFGADGKARLLRGVSVDVTARRESEQEVSGLRQELAHASRVTMLGQLSSALAHELSQPLGAILRNTEAGAVFLRKGSPDLEEIAAIFADIRKDNQRAGSVISRMRSLLKRGDLDLQTLEVAPLVREVVALIRQDALTRRVRIESAIAEDLPAMRGDRIQIQQVLLNLLINGMDAIAPDAPGERCVGIEIQPTGKGLIEIAVSDSGGGISADKLDKIFDPFFTTKAEGMGVGLAISRTIVDAHGGRIWAENGQGRGAIFRVTFPVVNSMPVGARVTQPVAVTQH